MLSMRINILIGLYYYELLKEKTQTTDDRFD